MPNSPNDMIAAVTESMKSAAALQCVIAVAGIGFGIFWAWRNRNAPLDRIRSLGLATVATCLLMVIRLRVNSDWLDLFLLISVWQIAPWCWIEIWRRIVNREGQEPAKK